MLCRVTLYCSGVDIALATGSDGSTTSFQRSRCEAVAGSSLFFLCTLHVYLPVGETRRETIVIGGGSSINFTFRGGLARTTGTTVDGTDIALDMLGDVATVGATECNLIGSSTIILD